jgi:hypothetical protein
VRGGAAHNAAVYALSVDRAAGAIGRDQAAALEELGLTEK